MQNNTAAPSPSSTSTLRTCTSTTFPVPLFLPGEYPRKSQRAHSVLGILLLLMVLTWLAHITQFQTPVKQLDRAYKCSGILQMLLGIYLLTWCFVLLKPSNLTDLYSYSTTDLLQLQHISISCSAICCGLSEYWYGCAKLKHLQWHVLWCINMCCIGMVFMVHPQPDFAGAATHTMLGMFIILGAIFFLGEKWHQFPEDLYESWNIVLAGGLYLFAASLLIKYEEAPLVLHHGFHIKCHRGAPVTLASLMVSSISFVLLLWFGVMPQWLVETCLERMEVLHEDPYAACVLGQWNKINVVDEIVERRNRGEGGEGDGNGDGDGDGAGEKDSLVSHGNRSECNGSGSSGRYSRQERDVELV